ncbi:hypothetical protein BL250_15000 [Erwinia sp. OLTSP20]|uniref:type 4 pilus major pilin n=1 Tax=unclassified Erwinia TaxID=2622719 RepID=UPI000C196AF0|nr:MULTISPECIES: type 4 pilus major pilin [unclassified Erwinia]PIJ49844.1 hypothetical protein BV501_11710 [Erwinia sp. OAMSP11]PIJ70943.1 hypothetical protein BK416_12900 [Erwinia sp. OLSSP12]PIJ80309.1 hypothetical protein BLD47_11765 [Erwinia sp. OLCASP19]PIJ82433.1 hypothetical protein BLD46_11515 [Erwinia sp. OLMTSP26]PIJ85118.1 hypothetical protein BLD49_11625 [Erwinia sp. OLMDSP33]
MKNILRSPFKTYHKVNNRLQKGLSLIESAMVLALSAVVIAGVVAYYQSASSNEKSEQTIAMLTSVISGVHSLYSSQSDYASIDTSTIAKSGMIPAQFVSEKDNVATITDPGGHPVIIGPGTINKPDDKQYWNIQFTVAHDLCPALARLNLGDSLVNMYIGDKNTAHGSKLTVSDAVQLCSAAAHDDNGFIDLYWVLR